MAQDPLKPKDSGKIGLPKVDSAMNKVAPQSVKGNGKGAKDPKKRKKAKPEIVEKPPLSDSTEDEGEIQQTDDPPEADSNGAAAPTTKGPDMDPKEKADLLARIRKRMDRAISSESDNRKDALDDLKFKAGQQWPADVAAQRNFDRRPCLTVNKLKTFVHQITNDQRQNRPAINVSPVGDRGDPEVAKMFRGMIRSIERASSADIAYDTAFDGAVSNGFGYWRILTEYENPNSFNQVIVIKRIRNAFTVYLDDMHQEPDGSDSKWGFVTEMVPRDEFTESWPWADPMPYTTAGTGDALKVWVTQDSVRIAEYYEVQTDSRTLIALSNGHIGWKDEITDEVWEQIASGALDILKERESDVPKVMWYKVSGADVLEASPWPSQWIPIVKVIGDEIDVEGKSKLSGVIRDAKDPQRMYNYWSPLALDTPLPTPDGWTTMGAVKMGDRLFADDGKPCTVVGLSPVHLKRECFKVNFDDGSSIVADAEHPWAVEERGKRNQKTFDWNEKVLSTKELVAGNHFIKVAIPLEMPHGDLPIHPYLLGAWLGDGTASAPSLCQGEQDMWEFRRILGGFGVNIGPVAYSGNRVGSFTALGVRAEFVKLGLLGNKHIPAQYLRGSLEQREMLLQGLMDTDGSITKVRQCSFSTVIPELASGFSELLRSLGIKSASIHRKGRRSVMPNGTASDCADCWQFSFTPGASDKIFRLDRKMRRIAGDFQPRRNKRFSIVSIESVPSVPVRCIAIDAPSHLFLAGHSMVPTHNTSYTEFVALQPKAPFIMEEGQIEGHEQEWKNANVKSNPVLTYKGTNVGGKPAPPPQRQPFGGVPAGIQQAIQNSAQDMMATTGIRFDATMQERMNDESGRALRELRRSGDIGSFHYIDNLGRSLKHSGRILIDLIPKIYDTKRVLMILREDDTEERVKLDPNQPQAMTQLQQTDGKKLKIYNPTFGEYGVTVTIGPSYATKRIEAAESMMDFARALPNTAQLIADLIAKNQDWPGAEEMAKRLAKAVPANLLTPDQKDMTPQVQALLQSMDMQIKALTAERIQMMKELTDKAADRNITLEKVNKDFEAKLLKIVADVETKTAATQEKAVASFNAHIGSRLTELGEGMTLLMQQLAPRGDAPGAPGPAAPTGSTGQPPSGAS